MSQSLKIGVLGGLTKGLRAALSRGRHRVYDLLSPTISPDDVSLDLIIVFEPSNYWTNYFPIRGDKYTEIHILHTLLMRYLPTLFKKRKDGRAVKSHVIFISTPTTAPKYFDKLVVDRLPRIYKFRLIGGALIHKTSHIRTLMGHLKKYFEEDPVLKNGEYTASVFEVRLSTKDMSLSKS